MVKASEGHRTESESLPLDLHPLVGVATSCGRHRGFPEKRRVRSRWKVVERVSASWELRVAVTSCERECETEKERRTNEA